MSYAVYNYYLIARAEGFSAIISLAWARQMKRNDEDES